MANVSRGLGLCAVAFMMPLAMRFAILVQRQFDSTYSDGPCFLKVVKTTNEEHYMRHPVWRNIEPQTSCSTTGYLDKQASAYFEQRVAWCFAVGSSLTSILAFVYLVCTKKQKVMDILVLLVFMDRMSQEMQGYLHIANDLTQVNGTILHHVPIWGGATQSNPGEGMKPIGDGMAGTMVVSGLGYMLATYFVVKGSRYPAKVAMAMFIPANYASTIFQMRKHTEVHAMGESAATSMNPLDRWYYICHIHGHHHDGLFCSHLNPALIFHDPSAYLMGRMMDAGLLHYGTWGFEAVAVGVEVFIFATSALKTWLMLWLLSKLHAKLERAMYGKKTA